MKQFLVISFLSVSLATTLLAQATTPSPIATPASVASAAAAVMPAATATATATSKTGQSSSDLADKIHEKLQKKLHGRHGITIDASNNGEDADLRKMRDFVAIPIVAIVFLSIFGAPVLIVVLIGIFTLLNSRSRQRTIRMMLEKGQPIPAELLAPAAKAVRQRSDVRRGVVWTMVGLGVMLFFGAVNDWEGGAWSLGLIPFLIGVGYLLIWKLEGKNSVPPPPPAP
jgi:uncharacterized protein DUF6249